MLNSNSRKKRPIKEGIVLVALALSLAACGDTAVVNTSAGSQAAQAVNTSTAAATSNSATSSSSVTTNTSSSTTSQSSPSNLKTGGS